MRKWGPPQSHTSIDTSSSADDDDDDDGGLWQQSQEQLSRVQGTCACTALNGLHCRHR